MPHGERELTTVEIDAGELKAGILKSTTLS